jgi:hypothetical protein
MPASLLPALRQFLWWALVLGIAISALNVRQVDLLWQLPEGQFILQNGYLPHAPPAAFGLPYQPYVDEYGLYEIALALLDRLGGFGAIWLVFVAVYLLIFAIPLMAARARRHGLISLACLALAGIFMIARCEQRPEIVGVLLAAVLMRLLHRTRGFSPGFLLRVALIFAVWTNIHSSYLIGCVALFLWLVERLFLPSTTPRWSTRQAAAALATAAAALLVNPYGWDRLAFTFAQEGDLGSNLLSREMWPTWDQTPLLQEVLLTAAVVLAAAFGTRNRPAPWVIAFAGAMFALSILHVRLVGFLAVALLFVYADRSASPLPGTLGRLARAALLGCGCVVMVLFDVLALRQQFYSMEAGSLFSDQEFAPALVRQLRTRGPAAVLCTNGMGAYLTFAGGGALRPLIDSGLGRFDDATKRFYFFVDEDPRSFDLALERLNVDDVLVTPMSAAWVPALADRPGWHLAAWNDTGLIFARGPVPAMLAGAGRDQLRDLHDAAQRSHDPVWAFCLSTLADDPETSLALLDRSRVAAWSEPFLDFFRPWLDRVPVEALDSFLQHNPGPGNPILRELVLTRVRPGAALPAVGPTLLEKEARVLDLLQRGDVSGARTLFSTLPRPVASALYYNLRDRLEPAAAKNDSASVKWQDWNAGGAELFQRLSPLLNRRISSPAEASTENR